MGLCTGKCGFDGEGGWHSLVVSLPHVANAQCKVPERRMLDSVICPRLEEMAHVSFQPGERSWRDARGGREQVSSKDKGTSERRSQMERRKHPG